MNQKILEGMKTSKTREWRENVIALFEHAVQVTPERHLNSFYFYCLGRVWFSEPTPHPRLWTNEYRRMIHGVIVKNVLRTRLSLEPHDRGEVPGLWREREPENTPLWYLSELEVKELIDVIVPKTSNLNLVHGAVRCSTCGCNLVCEHCKTPIEEGGICPKLPDCAVKRGRK